MITHCKFCKDKPLTDNDLCDDCPYNYIVLYQHKDCDGWDFCAGKYWVNVWADHSVVHIHDGKETKDVMTKILGTIYYQLPIDTTEEDLDLYLTFM